MGPEARIDRDCAIGGSAARGRIVPVEVRHRRFLSVVRLGKISGTYQPARVPSNRESSACL
jgi:hypothetical protein